MKKNSVSTMLLVISCLVCFSSLALGESSDENNKTNQSPDEVYSTFEAQYGSPSFLWEQQTWDAFSEALQACPVAAYPDDALRAFAFHTYKAPKPMPYHEEISGQPGMGSLAANKEYAIEQTRTLAKPLLKDAQSAQVYTISMASYAVAANMPECWKVTLIEGDTLACAEFSCYNDQMFQAPRVLTKDDPWYTPFVLDEYLQNQDVLGVAKQMDYASPSTIEQLEEYLAGRTVADALIALQRKYGLHRTGRFFDEDLTWPMEGRLLYDLWVKTRETYYVNPDEYRLGLPVPDEIQKDEAIRLAKELTGFPQDADVEAELTFYENCYDMTQPQRRGRFWIVLLLLEKDSPWCGDVLKEWPSIWDDYNEIWVEVLVDAQTGEKRYQEQFHQNSTGAVG